MRRMNKAMATWLTTIERVKDGVLRQEALDD